MITHASSNNEKQIHNHLSQTATVPLQSVPTEKLNAFFIKAQIESLQNFPSSSKFTPVDIIHGLSMRDFNTSPNSELKLYPIAQGLLAGAEDWERLQRTWNLLNKALGVEGYEDVESSIKPECSIKPESSAKTEGDDDKKTAAKKRTSGKNKAVDIKSISGSRKNVDIRRAAGSKKNVDIRRTAGNNKTADIRTTGYAQNNYKIPKK